MSFLVSNAAWVASSMFDASDAVAGSHDIAPGFGDA